MRRGGIVAAILLGAVLLACVIGPVLLPVDPDAILGPAWQPRSAAHVLGLDNLGRDMLARLLVGGRTSIGLALGATSLSFMLGIGAGFAAALAGGWVDHLLTRAFEILLAMPTLIFVLIILSVLGPSAATIILTLAVIDSTRVYRLARLLARDVLAQEYALQARLRGEGIPWMIGREILPNVARPLSAEAGLRFSFVFLLIAALAYLGLGLPPPLSDWGSMVRDNAPAIGLGNPAALYPAAAIALIAACVHAILDRLSFSERRRA
ncbi:MAG TPA: ABC transporter permease [Dongiaceae bacterium]|jgi:peptide/nickel transport system permease protein|nr:ABC transporter permease [Dongiaceae bacterium]